MWQSIIKWFVGFFAGKAMQSIIKTIPVIVAQIEQAMKDGKIDLTERKTIAMKVVDTVAAEMGLPVSGIVRWGISMLIDIIAKKLPSGDINIPEVMMTVIKEIKG